MAGGNLSIRLRPLMAPRPLRLYAVQRNLNSACSYYRQTVPWGTADDLGLARAVIDDYEHLTDKDRQERCLDWDVHHYYLLLEKGLIHRARWLRTLPTFWDATRKQRKKRPITVFDGDDDTEAVDVFNPRFATLGSTAPDGTALRHGARIWIKPEDGGPPVAFWEDGKIYGTGEKFDVRANRKRVELLKAGVRFADAATVTSEALADVYRSYGQKRVYVFPNSIRFDHFPRLPLRRHRRHVRILWYGGWSHYRDWYPLREALGRVMRRHRRARFIIWGQRFNWVHRQVPREQFEFENWLPFDAFHLRLSTMMHDIVVCPLSDSRFNRAKSGIKFYESAALTPPIPTLASRYGPYLEIEDGKTGLLFSTPEEFEEKLSALIEDCSFRRRLAENAKDWVAENRDAFKTVPKLLDFYREVIG